MNRINIENCDIVRKDKLHYKGILRDENIYRIRIDKLFYNDDNGRIASFVSDSAEDLKRLKEENVEAYNDQIMEFIERSESSDSFLTTKNSIKEIGQKDPGTILDDGRIIDGNRRYTCLRKLYKETKDERYAYFECFVLPCPSENDLETKRAIKQLEIEATYGIPGKQSYKPIDRLADLYRYVIGVERLFTLEEYQKSASTISLVELKKDKMAAETLWDYLKYVGMEGRWDYARHLKLDGPIREICNIKAKTSKNDWSQIQTIFFAYLKSVTTNEKTRGDATRKTRNFIKGYKADPIKVRDEYQKALIDKYKEKVFLNNITSSTEKKAKLEEIEKNSEKVFEKLEKIGKEKAREKAQNKPAERVADALEKLNSVELDMIESMTDEYLDSMENDLDKIIKKVERIKNKIENAR